MLRTLVTLTALLTTSAAATAMDCFSGSNEVLKLTDWSATAEGADRYNFTVKFQYTGDQPTRMVKATLNVFDVLGKGLTGGDLEPDLHLKPGETGEQKWVFSGDLRITRVLKEDVIANICTQAVVHEDGTREDF